MDISTVQANVISLVGVVVSLLLGLAVINGELAQIIVSTAGTVVSVAFSLYAELRVKTLASQGVKVKGVR
jgi:uncharacterized membrane protein